MDQSGRKTTYQVQQPSCNTDPLLTEKIHIMSKLCCVVFNRISVEILLTLSFKEISTCCNNKPITITAKTQFF